MRPFYFYLAAILDVACLSSEATAAPTAWQADMRLGYIILGGAPTETGEPTTTGGVMASADARHVWHVRDWLDASAGLAGGAFGFEDEAHWIGFVGGPTAGVSLHVPDRPFGLGLDLAPLDGGRLPVKNAWGMPMRYWGWYPAATISLSYATSDNLSFVAGCSARWVSTLGWTGASWNPSIAGRFSF